MLTVKGILLAGGRGTRLYPLTKATSKQLLPVYDKPMIYYPLSTLMLFGIKEILVISTPHDLPHIKLLLGDGASLGLSLSYAEQPQPEGIAQALMIGANFISNDSVCLILGDNIFYMGEQYHHFLSTVHHNEDSKATIFAYHVSNPQRFGVIEFNDQFAAISIEEKPAHPKSNFVSVGLYFYPSDVVAKARTLKKSKRGEYEITDLNNLYLKEKRLSVVPMPRGNAWLDAGTPDSLMDSSIFVQIIEKRQGLKIACLEEIAYHQGFISKEQLQQITQSLNSGAYKDYLQKVLSDAHDLY